VEDLITNFSEGALVKLLGTLSDTFRPRKEYYDMKGVDRQSRFGEVLKIGELTTKESTRIGIFIVESKTDLNENTGKGVQFDIGKKIIKGQNYNAGLFAFYDKHKNFRLSLIHTRYLGSKKQFSNFKRHTFYVSKTLPNKTFRQQIKLADFSSFRGANGILETFSLEAVSSRFYNDFKPYFEALLTSVKGNDSSNVKADFALLFVIRTIFIGFVQKKGWLGNDPKFLQNYLKEYRANEKKKDTFYSDWLEPLFFEALNTKPGTKVGPLDGVVSKETFVKLQMAPFLNGELFKRKKNVDNPDLLIVDKEIQSFFDFLFEYNFTIEENTLFDEELELNPEFLGIIFERIVNKEDGAIYTPRTEVDLMCRLALVKWLQKNTSCHYKELYELFFREGGAEPEFDEQQKEGSFSEKDIRELAEKLSHVTVCDPAAGSGAFEVGMLHVIQKILKNLYSRPNCPADLKEPTSFEMKSNIIRNSLYGVEVKRWAVWINQLRLWLTLFIDMDDESKISIDPLLPSLDFKVRCGDSLIQMIGNTIFPVTGETNLTATLKRKLTNLSKKKYEFFNNQKGTSWQLVRHEELNLFSEILNAQIEEKREALKNIFARTKAQYKFEAEGFPGEPKTKDSGLFIEEKKALEEDIESLKLQKQELKIEQPLIWKLEFAEIFFDRGGFDIIIGNPPYVRQEEIGDPNDKIKNNKEYKKLLHKMVRADFTDYFKPKVKINGKSDLYTYFYIRSLRLLNKNGVHVFVCSNSWLDVGYGVWFQQFLLQNVPIHFIIDNHAKRSFASSDINTIITVFGAPGKKIDANKTTVKFVAFKKPFEEAIFTENLLAAENAQELTHMGDLRIYPMTHAKLLEEGTEYVSEEEKKLQSGQYIGDKWGGKYLRAPDIFFTILKKGKGKFVKLKDVADIRFGIKTGCNEFFYLTEEDVKKWKIEPEFLKPVIKSPKDCETTTINREVISQYVFICNKSKNELTGTKALEYIRWGESASFIIPQGKDKGKTIKGYHKIESVKNRKHWWNLGERKAASLNFNYLINDIGHIYVGEVLVSDNFHEIHTGVDLKNFLNSTLFWLFQNLTGRASFGGGLLKIQRFELSEMYILDSDFGKHGEIMNRSVKSVFVECGIIPNSEIPILKQNPKPLTDRAALDKMIFDALELTEEERKEVYRAVCQLVWNRISKAKSVKKRR